MADSDPVTWRLALIIQAQLQLILVADGFFTDLGNQVFVEDVQFADSQVFPVASVDVNATKLTDSPTANKRQRSIDFTIEVAIKPPSPAQQGLPSMKQTAHRVIADVESAFSRPVNNAPKNIRGAKLTGASIIKRPEGLTLTVVQFTGTANYLPD